MMDSFRWFRRPSAKAAQQEHVVASRKKTTADWEHYHSQLDKLFILLACSFSFCAYFIKTGGSLHPPTGLIARIKTARFSIRICMLQSRKVRHCA